MLDHGTLLGSAEFWIAMVTEVSDRVLWYHGASSGFLHAELRVKWDCTRGSLHRFVPVCRVDGVPSCNQFMIA